MRTFILSMVFTVLLLFVVVELVAPIVGSRHVDYKLPVHKTLYLERRLFDDQMEHILAAAIEWSEVTNGQVVFDIKRMPQRNIDPADAIIVLNVTPDYPEAILLDATNEHTTLGFFNDTHGLAYIAFIDERIDAEDYTSVAMHEMGHSLGLEHIKGFEGIGALMYPSVELGGNHITQTDLRHFCKLYHCDYTKMHGSRSIYDLLHAP